MIATEARSESLDSANQRLTDSIQTLKSNLGTKASNAKILSIVPKTPCPTKCVNDARQTSVRDEFVDARLLRGLEIAMKKDQIRQQNGLQFLVKSQSTYDEYQVLWTRMGWVCSCADRRFRGSVCKHICAIFFVLNGEEREETEPVEV